MSNTARRMNDAITSHMLKICTITLVVCSVLMVCILALAKRDGFLTAIAEQNKATAVYDQVNMRSVKSAATEAQRVVGEAWLACSRSKRLASGKYESSVPPSEAELNGCEIQALNLAAARGVPAEEGRHFIQSAREASLHAYASAVADSEQKKPSGGRHVRDKLLGLFGITPSE